jgi:hypothetical protein
VTFRLDDDLEGEDSGDDLNADSDLEGDESGAGKDPKSADKRISEMQSERDRETARANKAEKELKRVLARQGADSGAGAPPASSGGDVANDAVLDMARMFAFQQHPKLAEYGLSAADLDGSSPAEIAEGAVSLVARFEKIETQARNKVLAETGHAPEIEGQSPPATKRDYSKMSKEDFDKVVAKALATPAQT